MIEQTRAGVIAAGLALCAALPALAQESKPAVAFVLPDGNAKATVETTCVGCHDLGRIVNANHSPAEWRNVVNMMLTAGAKLSPAQKQAVTDYLIEKFPGKAKPQPVIAAGPVQVVFREWQAPTPGSRPHDPLATPDGALWYTGQMANLLGRVDPQTGAIKEYPLTTPNSGPHGLTDDSNGDIWFTASFAGYVGKLDPKSGAVTEYRMPDPAARDPHTLLFDRTGILWFTVQGGNMIGRLDPKTSAVKLISVPTPRALPYGMALGADGETVFVDLFGTNKIAGIDRATMALKEYSLPDASSRPRRIAVTGDGGVWYSDYARGRLGRLDPQSGRVTEYASPGGTDAQPYAITALNDVIWYVETGPQPNALVRFDPKTERFQTWAIPSGGGVVRNMMPTRDGNLALACSGVNGVALVEIKNGGS
jgi:virginiamycin B lyase